MLYFDFSFEKRVQEEVTKVVNFSYSSEIMNGEEIKDADVSIYDNVGRFAPDILVGHTFDFNKVKFRVRGGKRGMEYKIVVKTTTNLGHKREVDVAMLIRDI